MGQNLKYDMNVLARIGLKLEGLQEDSMLAAYILDATRSPTHWMHWPGMNSNTKPFHTSP